MPSDDTDRQDYLAIDPGGTTGLAMRLAGMGYYTCTTETPEQLWDWLCNFKWTHVVCEQFGASLISTHGLYTVRLIGGVHALCYHHKVPFTIKPPAHRKAYQKQAEEALKGRYHVIHETEALAHLLSWEAKNAQATTNKPSPH